MKKWLAIFCLLTVFVLALCGCAAGGDGKLTGTWRMLGPVQGTVDVYLTFGEDGTVTARYNGITEQVAYEQSGENGLLINDSLFTYKLSGNNLALSYVKLQGEEDKEKAEKIPFTMDAATITIGGKTYTYTLDEATGKTLTLTQTEDGVETVYTYKQTSKRKVITTGTWRLDEATRGGSRMLLQDIYDEGQAYAILLKLDKDSETNGTATLTPAVLIDAELSFEKTDLPADIANP
ncbi:MAG: hypothetical protein IKP10_04650 [Clostridia bacterium]|nr:hypothetical protein [Clostridia bacterium]